MNSIDPLQLQRLVDGELGIEQWQSMLATADRHPDQWREIATAMVEDRLWQRSFCLPVASLNAERKPGPTVPAVDGKPEIAGSDRNPGNRFPQRWGWLAIAASLLLAFGIGYWLPSGTPTGVAPDGLAVNQPADEDQSLGKDQLAQVSQQTSPSDLANRLTPTVYQPDYHLEFPEDSGLLSDEEVGPMSSVPLYSVASPVQLRRYQEMQATPTRITPQLAQQLNAAGYYVKQNVEFISGRMNGDQKLIVPVRTTRFLPSQ